MDRPMYTPKRVKQLRGKFGMTQMEFGRAIGFEGSAANCRASEIESGRRFISSKTAIILSMAEDRYNRGLPPFPHLPQFAAASGQGREND
jgi:transcriptional regulator with XRE-family HTH domain